jgi:hypothetical protein
VGGNTCEKEVNRANRGVEGPDRKQHATHDQQDCRHLRAWSRCGGMDRRELTKKRAVRNEKCTAINISLLESVESLSATLPTRPL